MDENLVQRAFRAYFHRDGHYSDIPANTSGLVAWRGKWYVVLENCNGPLAVYRVRTSGALKRLRRWPPQVGCR